MTNPIPLEQHASEIIQAMRDAVPLVTEAVVKLTFAEGVSKIFLGAVLLVFAIIAAVVAAKAAKKPFTVTKPYGSYGCTTEEPSKEFFIMLAAGLAGFIAGPLGLTTISDGLIYVIAPEGKTIMNIISAIRGSVPQ